MLLFGKLAESTARARLNPRPEDTAPAACCDAGLCREEGVGRRRGGSRRGVWGNDTPAAGDAHRGGPTARDRLRPGLVTGSLGAVAGLGLEQTVELGSPLGAQQGLDQGVRSLLCATARRTDKSYDSVGCWKDEPLGAQPLTCEAKENLRSIVLKGPFEPAKLRVLPSPVTGASRSRGVPEPR